MGFWWVCAGQGRAGQDMCNDKAGRVWLDSIGRVKLGGAGLGGLGQWERCGRVVHNLPSCLNFTETLLRLKQVQPAALLPGR